MKLYLTTDMEFKANEIQVQHSSILVDPIMEDLEMFLEREVPMQYASWTIPTRLAYQKGAYSEPNSTMTSLNMVCARQIIEELETEHSGEGQGLASCLLRQDGADKTPVGESGYT